MGKSAYAIANNGGTMGGIIGDQTGGAGGYAWAIANNGGTIGDITGDQTGGVGESAYAIANNGTMGGIDGDQTGGAGGYAYAIYNNGGTMGDIDGSLICGPSGLFPIYGPFKLAVDLDPVRPSGISSTDEEVSAAAEVGGLIVEWLCTLGWPLPLQACSGNGWHLLYQIS